MLRRILLAAVAAGVLAVVLVAVVRRQERTAGGERQATRLLSFDERAVTGLTLTAGGAAWTFARDGESWRLVAPVADAADAAAVGALLRAAHGAPIVQTIAEPDALSSYGLEPPSASIAIAGPAVPAIDVGQATPAGDGVFVRVAGRPGVLVAKLPEAEPLQKAAPLALRATSWLGFEATEIRGVRVERGGAVLALARGGGSWWIESPRRLPAAAAQVERLLAAIAGTRVAAVDDGAHADDPKLGLGSGAVRIEVTTRESKRRLVLGAAAAPGRRYATSDARGTILVVDAARIDAAPLDLDALRDPRLTDINRYAVVKLDYASGGARFAAARVDDATWSLPSGARIPSADVYTFLVSILEARTTSFSAASPGGSPTGTLVVELEDGTRSTIDFYRGARAAWDRVPGTVFALAAPPPPPPQK